MGIAKSLTHVLEQAPCLNRYTCMYIFKHCQLLHLAHSVVQSISITF